MNPMFLAESEKGMLREPRVIESGVGGGGGRGGRGTVLSKKTKRERDELLF